MRFWACRTFLDSVSLYPHEGQREGQAGRRGACGAGSGPLRNQVVRRRAAFRRRSSPLLHRLRWPSCAHTNQQQVHGETVLLMPIRQMRRGSTGWYRCSAPSEAMLHPRSHTVHRQIGGGGNRVSGGMTSSYSYRALQIRTKRKAPISSGAHLNMMRVYRQSQTIHTLTLSHPRTDPAIVLTRAGILGLRSRLARSGPGGPAQPLQVSRLHRHTSCLTCATSPHPTPSVAFPHTQPSSGHMGRQYFPRTPAPDGCGGSQQHAGQYCAGCGCAAAPRRAGHCSPLAGRARHSTGPRV